MPTGTAPNYRAVMQKAKLACHSLWENLKHFNFAVKQL